MARSVDAGVRGVARRRYWREADARVLIEAWRGSGQPLSRFARRYAVEPRRLADWARRLADRKPEPMVLHPVQLVQREQGARAAGAIEIQLVSGPSVRVPAGFASEDLQRVLIVLRESRAC